MTTDNPSEPATVSAKSTPPKTRFSTPQGVMSAYQAAKTAHLRNAERLADIRRAYDRMPPQLTPEEEEQLNGFPNVNRGELRAKTDTYVSSWIDLHCGGERIAEVRCKKHDTTETEQNEYSRLCTKFFNEAQQRWEFDEPPSLAYYILESVIRDTQMGLFGIGPCGFKDTTDWRFCALPNRMVIVPEGTKITLRNCPCMWLESEENATTLYQMRNREGWNEKAVLDFLYRKINPKVQNGQIEDRAAWQNRIANNLDLSGQEFTPYTLVHCYVQEFSAGREKNGISHYIVGLGEETQFLYEKEREYKTFGQCVIAFCDNAGPEGDWHGVRGFGDMCFDLCHLNDKFFNHVARVGLVTSLPWFEGVSEADRQKLVQIRIGLLGILTDLQMKQQRVQGDMNGCIEVIGEASRTLDRNTRIFPQNDSGPRGEAPTATQVAFDRQDQAQFSGLQIKFNRAVCIDRLLSEQYRRLTAPANEYPESLPGGKTAAEFRKKCKDAKIPEKCWRDVEYVRASRSGGSGNAAADGQKAMNVLGIATPGPGQHAARKEVVAANYGWDRVGEFVEDEPVPDDIDVQIATENSLINLGQAYPAFPNQDHQRHLGTPDPNGPGHLSILAATHSAAMQIQQMGIENALDDAMKLDRIMEACLGHCDMHAGFLESEPKFKESAKQVRAIVNQFGQFVKVFSQAVGDAVKAKQPQGPQISAEDQAKLMSAQIDAKIKEVMAAQDLKHKEEAHNQKLGNLAERSAFKTMSDEQKHLQQLGQEAENALIDQERQKQELVKTRAQENLSRVEGNGNGT